MEKILKQLEDNEVIANPKQYIGSLMNKVFYKSGYLASKLNLIARRIFNRHTKV